MRRDEEDKVKEVWESKGQGVKNNLKQEGIFKVEDSLGLGEVGEGSGLERFLEIRFCDFEWNRGGGRISQFFF